MVFRNLMTTALLTTSFLPAPWSASARPKKERSSQAPYSAGLRGGNFLGGAVGLGFGLGLEISQELSAEFIFMNGAISLEKQDTYPGVDTEELSAGASQTYVRLSYTFMEPMFVSMGLGQRSINASTKVVSSFDRSSVSSEVAIQSNVLVIEFGSRWTFARKIQLGVDWFSLSIPFHKYGNSKTRSEGQTTSNLEALSRNNETATEKLGSASIFGLLVLNASFKF